MSITFQCAQCGQNVQAPDAAAGKRGKCPHCGASNEVPAPAAQQDENLIPLAPIDEHEEKRRQEEIRRLIEQEHDVIAETGGEAPVPLEQRENVTAEDLHHLVVNYCLDLADSQLERAQTHVEKLREFGAVGKEAANDFLTGRVVEPGIDRIPARVREGFLKQLARELC